MDNKEKEFQKDLLMSNTYNKILKEFQKDSPSHSKGVISYMRTLFGVMTLECGIIFIVVFLKPLEFWNLLTIPNEFENLILSIFVLLFFIIIIMIVVGAIYHKCKVDKRQATVSDIVEKSTSCEDVLPYLTNVELLKELILEIKVVNEKELLKFNKQISLLSQIFSITVIASFIGYASNQSSDFWKFFTVICIIFCIFSYIYLGMLSGMIDEFVKEFILPNYSIRESISNYLQEILYTQLQDIRKLYDGKNQDFHMVLAKLDIQNKQLEEIEKEISELNYFKKWRNKLK